MSEDEVSWLGTFLMGAGCIAIGYLLGITRPKLLVNLLRFPFHFPFRTNTKPPVSSSTTEANKDVSSTTPSNPLEIEKLAEILEDFKMVLVVRNDLKMGKGKIAAQCSHATLGLYKKLHRRAPKALNRWEMCGQVKVVLKSESEEDLLMLQESAKSLKLPTHITIDAGRTQIARSNFYQDSRTVMAILGPADMVDDVTGRLKLL